MNLPADASNDQANCPQGYYRNTSGMVRQIGQQTAVVSVKVYVAGLSLAEIHSITQEKLSEAIQLADPKTDAALILKIYAEVKDRLDGKAVQEVRQSNELTITTNSYGLAPEALDQMMIDHLTKRQRLAPKVIDN